MSRSKISFVSHLFRYSYCSYYQSGQALVAGISFAVVLSVLLIILLNKGTAYNKKIALVQTADSIAEHAGTLLVRRLNFIAYTNRAMVSNYMAAGHIIGYLSWLEYYNDVIQESDLDGNGIISGQELTADIFGVDNLGLINRTCFAPALAGDFSIVCNLGALSSIFLESLERTRNEVVPNYLARLDELNRSFFMAQLDTLDQLEFLVRSANIPVAQNFPGDIKINDLPPQEAVINKVGDPAYLAILTDRFSERSIDNSFVDVRDFTEPYHYMALQETIGHYRELLRQQFNRTYAWYTGRNWSASGLLSIYEPANPYCLIKTGRSEAIIGVGGIDWRAEDQLTVYYDQVLGSCDISGPRETVAVTDISASTVLAGYQGIAGYSQLVTTPADNQLELSVVASVDIHCERLSYALTGIEGGEQDENCIPDPSNPQSVLTATSRIVINYERPNNFTLDPGSLFSRDEEKANLFNPFWQFRLSGF